MVKKSGSLRCPLCGSVIEEVSDEALGILRDLILSDVLGAYFHDIERAVHWHIAEIEFILTDVVKNALSRKEKGRITENSKRVVKAVRNYRRVIHYLSEVIERRVVKPITEMREEIKSVPRMFGLETEINFSPLTTSDKKIDRTLYIMTLFLALRVGLVMLSSERRPELGISFVVERGRLETRLLLGYEHSYSSGRTRASVDQFHWAVSLVGGESSITEKKRGAVIAWTVPTVS